MHPPSRLVVVLVTAGSMLESSIGMACAKVSEVTSGSSLSNVSRPWIVGIARQGETLTAHHGAWTGTTPFRFDYQWQRCDAAGTGCAFIPPPMGPQPTRTLTLTSADPGHTIRVRVIATDSDGGHAAARSRPTDVVVGSSAPSA